MPPAAVSIPITWPAALASGPPESPGRMSAFVSSMPNRVSISSELESLALIVRSRLLMTPGATVGEPPCAGFVPDGQDGGADRDVRGVADLDRLEPGRVWQLEQGHVVGPVVAEDLRLVTAARRYRRDRHAGGAIDDVVVGQHQPGGGVDDEARALRRFVQILQVGVDVDDCPAPPRCRRPRRSAPRTGSPRRRSTCEAVPPAPAPGWRTASVVPTPPAAASTATTKYTSSPWAHCGAVGELPRRRVTRRHRVTRRPGRAARTPRSRCGPRAFTAAFDRIRPSSVDCPPGGQVKPAEMANPSSAENRRLAC